MILAKDGFACRSFVGSGGAAEHYILVEAPANVPLATQIDAVERRYADALASLRLSPESAVFRRLYASDILNQAPALRQSRLHDRDPANPVAVSMIQQAPLGRGKIAVIAYHDAGVDAAAKRRLGPKHIEVRKKDLGHLWSTRLCTGDDIGAIQVEEQTRQIFGDLCDTLATRGATLADHCVRTWIYVKDVDVFYDAMVKARRALFADHGMTKDTHFIASTGIEGACAHRYDLVSM
ncbi:MAG: RidA family protein, partial [Alphaproteobacteria bacterium]|nr:RidA family protein [Alphaproteobacteria bacterium]